MLAHAGDGDDPSALAGRDHPSRRALDADEGTVQVGRHDVAPLLDGHLEQAIVASRIEAARAYAETGRCRRAELLAYFGDYYDPPCGNCDNDGGSAAGRTEFSLEQPHSGRRVRHRLWGERTLVHQDEHELIVIFDEADYRTLTAATLASGLALTAVGCHGPGRARPPGEDRTSDAPRW